MDKIVTTFSVGIEEVSIPYENLTEEVKYFLCKKNSSTPVMAEYYSKRLQMALKAMKRVEIKGFVPFPKEE